MSSEDENLSLNDMDIEDSDGNLDLDDFIDNDVSVSDHGNKNDIGKKGAKVSSDESDGEDDYVEDGFVVKNASEDS